MIRRWFVWRGMSGNFVASPHWTNALWTDDIRQALWTDTTNPTHIAPRIQRAMAMSKPCPLSLGTSVVDVVDTEDSAKRSGSAIYRQRRERERQY